jgi:DNA-binding NarL/FixJ family response regulator
MHCLLALSDSALSATVSAHLRKHGHQVATAHSREAILGSLRGQTCDVIVVDSPGSGDEVAGFAAQVCRSAPHIALAVVAGTGNPALARRLTACGAIACLTAAELDQLPGFLEAVRLGASPISAGFTWPDRETERTAPALPPLVPAVADVAQVIRTQERLTTTALRGNVRMFTQVEPGLRTAMPPEQLGQVLRNLLLNAGQAIVETGGHAGLITVTARRAGDTAVIEIVDTGCGMEPAVQGQIFTPQFTTRRQRGGMGLGLSMCRDLVTRIGGSIHFASSPGQGSTFWLTLPLAPADDMLAVHAEGTGTATPRSRATDTDPAAERSMAARGMVPLPPPAEATPPAPVPRPARARTAPLSTIPLPAPGAHGKRSS